MKKYTINPKLTTAQRQSLHNEVCPSLPKSACFFLLLGCWPSWEFPGKTNHKKAWQKPKDRMPKGAGLGCRARGALLASNKNKVNQNTTEKEVGLALQVVVVSSCGC